MGKPTLFLAAGHGGSDPGNTSAGIVERDELISFVGGMRQAAQTAGYPTGVGGLVFVPDSLDLQGEIDYLNNNWKAEPGDLGVDFHLDYNTEATGALVIVDQSQLAIQWGTRFLDQWTQHTGIANRGVHDSKVSAQAWRGWDNFGWCRYPWSAVIVELGCLNSASDMAKVRHCIGQAYAMLLSWQAWTERNA